MTNTKTYSDFHISNVKHKNSSAQYAKACRWKLWKTAGRWVGRTESLRDWDLDRHLCITLGQYYECPVFSLNFHIVIFWWYESITVQYNPCNDMLFIYQGKLATIKQQISAAHDTQYM